MTQAVSSNYLAALKSKTKQPIWLAIFSGVPTRFSSRLFPAPAGPTKSYWIGSGASSYTGQITVDQGTSSIGDFSFSLLDKNQEITSMLSVYPLLNRQVTIKQGFVGILESEFASVFQGRVFDMQLQSDNVTWTFSCTNNLKMLDQSFMTASSSLLAGMLVGDLSMSVVAFLGPTQKKGFANATGVGGGNGTQLFYLLVDNEVISYTGIYMPGAPPAPVVAVSASGGILGAGTYYIQVTWVTATGETMGSVEASVVIGSGTTNSINVTIPAFSAPVTSFNIYMNNYSGGEQLSGNFSTGAGGTYVITAVPAAAAAFVPTASTVGQFTGLARGQYGTAAAVHSAGANVTQFMVIQDNALTIALKIMLSTGAGTNGIYDVLPLACGLAIPQALVDWATIAAQAQTWLTGYNLLFELFAQENAKNFIESEIYQVVNAYPTITSAGLISAKVYAPPLPTQQIQTVNDDTVIGQPAWSGSLMSRYFFNEVVVSYDFAWAARTYPTISYYENLASQTLYNQLSTKTINSRGLRTAVIGATKINNLMLNRFLRRFATPTPVIQADTLFSTRQIEMGDIVNFSSSVVPDLVKGVRGVKNQLVEVIEVDPDYDNYHQRYQLLATGYSYGKKYGVISPSSVAPTLFPVYASASAAQRNYGFIGTKVNNTKGMMPDGADAYYVTP